MQAYGTQGDSAQFMPLLIEIYRDAKAIFKPTRWMSRQRNRREEFSYFRGRGLEQAIEDMGEVLHAQYTITYSPSNADEPGFHQIAVECRNPNAHSVRSRRVIGWSEVVSVRGARTCVHFHIRVNALDLRATQW